MSPAIVDSDSAGRGQKDSLLKDLHKDFHERIIDMEKIVDVEQVEVEDLILFNLIERYIFKLSHGADEDFIDSYNDSKALLPQMEVF